jgi:hypothetical protein
MAVALAVGGGVQFRLAESAPPPARPVRQVCRHPRGVSISGVR